MKGVLDSAKIELPCPHCGHKFSETIGRLKTVQKLTCRSCGQAFDVDATQMRAEVQKVEKQLAKTLAAFSRLGK